MTTETYTASRRYFALATAILTLGLITIGGLVTSHEAGLAVPDWPNTYGYNMFFFPVSQWVGGIFYEHTHRLIASAVGLMTVILALWFHGRNARPVVRWGGIAMVVAGMVIWVGWPARWQDASMFLNLGFVSFAASFLWPTGVPARRWLRIVGVAAAIAVVIQGVLGGLRVTQTSNELGIFHAGLAQAFFALMAAVVLFHTSFWTNLPRQAEVDRLGLRGWFIASSLVIMAQLVVGSLMRHQHAGLAIPDFPLAYGNWWPDMSPEAIVRYNQSRVQSVYSPITAYQVALQMVHRIVAVIAFCMVAISLWRTRRQFESRNPISRMAAAWMFLMVVQLFLGATTIWTNKSADIATLHVAFGALALVNGVLLSIVAVRHLRPVACETALSNRPLPSPVG